MTSNPNIWNVNFASDNVAGAAPEIMTALQEASTGFAMPYGNDDLTEIVRRRLAETFETELAAYPVATGTAANSLALSVLSPPYGVVFCHEGAHIEEDECAAPEFYIGGGKLTLLSGENGKFSADTLAKKLGDPSAASAVHHAQPAAVSISQLTEKGTAYSLDEIRAIADVAHAHGLKLHMDGARFTNAMLGLGCSPAEATWKAGVDALSFGATKNGAFAAEAVIFFDPQAAKDFEFRRKRGGHLFSKMRFLSAQIAAYLENDNWLRYARTANDAARRLADDLTSLSGVELLHVVEGNEIFARISGPVHQALRSAGCQYYAFAEADDGSVGIRLVTAFNTTEADTEHFLKAARAGAGEAAA
ncbi:low specificity L-threonine aldolase [Nisaea sp.]|uniref:threonine aldolase family protein n=1 Tax=Nisaea sp. TaxID=2024842 RepID=UPI002B278CAB|nr:low specificity L-threonine aldolase [Nisaea sp.]